jgi:hypothetical protein
MQELRMRMASGPTKYLGTLLVLGLVIPVANAETGQPGATIRSNPWAHSHQYIVQSSTALEARRNVIATGPANAAAKPALIRLLGAE